MPKAKPKAKPREHKGVEVRKCVTGSGVFALRRYRAGELVGRVLGKMHDDPDYASEYCIDMGENLSLEPHAPFRFLNHCCAPNCQLYSVDHPTGKPSLAKVIVETLAVIQPGEQLTIDYGWTADAAIPCLCGHAQCRGWVCALEEMPKLAQAK
ncbi:MAG TPA: SET domain-containing protein [Pirellulales bacterium]